MATSITKVDLALLHDAFRAELRQNTKDLIADQRESLQPLRKELGEINTKLDAIMSGDILVTRHQLIRLVEKLNAQGFSVDEKEIFAV